MPDTQHIEGKFWKALRSDMTVMLGVSGAHDVTPRPMTAQIDGEADQGPIWFFTSKDSTLAKALTAGQPSYFNFVAKGHDVWASVSGRMAISNDRAVIDRLWNGFIAAWYEGGKDDPDLCLMRFDPKDAEIWLDGSSLLAGLKVLFGSDPKEDYAGNVAKVSLA
jgi:general stress protein 26